MLPKYFFPKGNVVPGKDILRQNNREMLSELSLVIMCFIYILFPAHNRYDGTFESSSRNLLYMAPPSSKHNENEEKIKLCRGEKNKKTSKKLKVKMQKQ